MRVLTPLLLAVAIFGMRGASPAAAQSAGCAVSPSELSIDAEEQAALDSINVTRADLRLPALTLSTTLTQASAWKSVSLAATGVLSHDDPGRSWAQRVAECGYRSASIAENLAAGVDTGRAAVQMWRDSGAHFRNMTNPSMRVVGVARVRGAGGWWWTAVFGAEGGDAGASPTPQPSTTSAPPAAPPTAGRTATVNAGKGDCLNVRATPTTTAQITTCLPDGATVRVIAGPREAEGITWWQIEGGGWVSGEFLRG